jgi:acetyltransferase-like isoleucine patch superfamily enzyme
MIREMSRDFEPWMVKAVGLQESLLGPVYLKAYRAKMLRPLIRRMLNRSEGGIMLSRTWRRIMLGYEGVVLGDFSRGKGIRPGLFPSGTRIGNFSCFAEGLQVLRRNHPPERFSQHPLFFNRVLGLVPQDAILSREDNPLTIGSDVWIGLGVTICPGCRSIGDGAIVGAGSVVTRDIPSYTIVGGNPARLIRRRFTPEVEAVVAASEWWLRPSPDIVRHLNLFTAEITEDSLRRFAAAFPARSSGGRP